MSLKKNELSIAPLKKAVASLQSALVKEPANELERDGVIQRFEYTFELSWKVLKKYLELNQPNSSEMSVKDLFREAGKLALIDSVEKWFEYLKARNLTSHTYNDTTAEDTFEVATRFLVSVSDLVKKLEKRLSG